MLIYKCFSRAMATGLVALLALFAQPAQASYASATSELDLTVEFEGPANFATFRDLNGGTLSLGGFGLFDRNGSGQATVTGLVWKDKLLASADASAVWPQSPSSMGEASLFAKTGKILDLYNDPAFNAGTVRVRLIFGAFGAIDTSAFGDAYAFASTDFKISGSGNSDPVNFFYPSQPLTAETPPASTFLLYSAQFIGSFNMLPGDRYAVTLNNGYVTAFTQAAAVPEPASWLVMLTGLAMIGLAMRQRQCLARIA